MNTMRINKKFWNGTRWNGHAAFQTIGHQHICCYIPADGFKSCDIMVVECADGRWYVEDNWGGDAENAIGVWNPFNPDNSLPSFFSTKTDAVRHAVAVLVAVSGVDREAYLQAYLEVA